MGTVYSISAADHTTGQFTITGHGRSTGDGPVAIYSPNGAVPTLLTALADAWLIVVDANTVKLASSSANALAGTALAFSDNGSGALKLFYGIPYRRARTYAAGTQVPSADLNAAQDALQSRMGGLAIHGAVSWLGVSGATIVVPDDTSNAARIDLAASGKAYSPMPEVVPGTKIGSLDCNVKVIVTAGSALTINLMRQKVDFSANAEVVATASSTGGTGAWTTLSIAANHTVAVGYVYYLTATQSGVGSSQFTNVTVVPG